MSGKLIELKNKFVVRIKFKTENLPKKFKNISTHYITSIIFNKNRMFKLNNSNQQVGKS